MRYVIIYTLLFSMTGCATVLTGKYQDVPITSEPPGAKVRSDTGISVITPSVLTLIRNRDHTVVAKYKDCEFQQKQLKHKLQGWFWANILLGGIIGGIVDVSSGASDELHPKQIHFDFTNCAEKQNQTFN